MSKHLPAKHGSSIFLGLCIPFLLSVSVPVLLSFTRWETSQFSCYLLAYLSHFLRFKAVSAHQFIQNLISFSFVFPHLSTFLYKASLLSLQVTLTHFALSSYKRDLWLPTSFSILDLNIHNLAYAFSIFLRESFFLPCLSFLKLGFFGVELTLSTPCSRFDPSLSRQSAALTILILSYLTISPLGLMALSSFRFGKGGSGVFANCLLCVAEATLSHLAGPECFNFSAGAWAILQTLAAVVF